MLNTDNFDLFSKLKMFIIQAETHKKRKSVIITSVPAHKLHHGASEIILSADWSCDLMNMTAVTVEYNLCVMESW